MAERRRRQNYIQGNTVRKINEEPVRRQQQRPQQRPQKKASYQVRKNRERALQMSRGYIVALVVSAVILVGLSVWYINVKVACKDMSDSVISLQQQLSAEEESNDALYDSVVDSVNLTDVRKKAMEMGMQPAGEDQKRTYSGSSKDNVRQYEEIPKSGTLAESKKTTD